MEREEFIKNLGLGLVAVCSASALAACSGKMVSPSPAPAPGGSGTVSVSLTNNLVNVGDQVVSGSVLMFRIATGNSPSSFVATQALCPHQHGNLNWINSQSLILCASHASEYTDTGSIIRQPQSGGNTRALKIYATSVTNGNLVVTVV